MDGELKMIAARSPPYTRRQRLGLARQNQYKRQKKNALISNTCLRREALRSGIVVPVLGWEVGTQPSKLRKRRQALIALSLPAVNFVLWIEIKT